jgi:hypothetical protein
VAGMRSPGKGQNMKIIDKLIVILCFIEKISNPKNHRKCIKIDYFWMKLGVLNEKMMPDATVMVLDLETIKKLWKIDGFGRTMWWYPGIT